MPTNTVKLSARALARNIAAQHGVTLDAAQRLLDASAKVAAAKQDAADSLEPMAQRIARDRGLPIEKARVEVARILADVEPAAIKGTDLVPSSRSAARRIAAQRGISIDAAQRLVDPARGSR